MKTQHETDRNCPNFSTIKVRDVIENTAPVFDEGSSTTRSIAENSPKDTPIGEPVTATDTTHDKLRYTLHGGDSDTFKINSRTGQIKVKRILDYETKNVYTVYMQVSDRHVFDTISVTINVLDVYEEYAPEFDDGDSTRRSVDEAAETGTKVGHPIPATDRNGDSYSYALGGTDAASFTINAETGQLYTAIAMDSDTKSNYEVTISLLDDEDVISDTITVTIYKTVHADNHLPYFSQGQRINVSIAENTAPDQPIGDALTATDEDEDTLTYILSGEDASHFSINENTGQLETKGALNYEMTTQYKITVTVRDPSNEEDVIFVTVQVTDIENDITPVRDRSPIIRDDLVSAFKNRDTVDDITASDLSRITYLRLQHKGITSLRQGDFDGMTNLTTIILDGNELTSLPDNMFAGLSSLSHLVLSNNQLSTITAGVLNGLSSLASLSLSENNITSLPADVFTNTTNLESIKLSNNELSTIPDNIFSGLSSLWAIELNGNALTSLPDTLFSGLTSLKKLSIANNSIETIPEGLFSDNTGLVYLDMSNNLLHTLPDNTFDGLSRLRTLNLSGNPNDPVPLTMILLRRTDQTVVASIQEAAPFDITLTLTTTPNSRWGTEGGNTTTLKIHAGELESRQSRRVTRRDGQTGQVIVDITGTSELPDRFTGLKFVKHSLVPTTVIR